MRTTQAHTLPAFFSYEDTFLLDDEFDRTDAFAIAQGTAKPTTTTSEIETWDEQFDNTNKEPL